MKFIETLSYSKILELIFDAKTELFISLPSIDNEIAEALIERANEVIIKVVIDNSEETIRNGYGDVKAIYKIINSGIEVKQCNGNFISFIISDKNGYFIFPQSRIFTEEPKGNNAIKIDPTTIYLLINNFFIVATNLYEIQNEIDDVISMSMDHFKDVSSGIHPKNILSQNFNEKEFQAMKRNLDIRPPLEPDIQRQINVYTAKIQYVELKFSGGGIENTIATLPKKAIPINSDELKNLLLTKIKMFQDLSENTDYQEFLKLKTKVELLRKGFLTPITCREGKSIIKIEFLEEFKHELDLLKKEAMKLNEVLPEVLEEAKLNTIDLLLKELKIFLTNNEPEELKKILKEELKVRMLNALIKTIIESVKFPDIKKLIEHISLNANYYDLTWNDFRDEKLLQELERKKVMKQEDIYSIINLKKAFDIKK